MPADSTSTGSSTDVVKALILRIAWQLPLWVLVSFALAVGLIYFLQTRPIVAAESERLESVSLQQVVNKTENLSSQIERILLTTMDWAKDGTLQIDDIEGFNRVMMPALNQRALVSSVHLAQESGRELLLLKGAQGIWRNRFTDVPLRGEQQRWLDWSATRKKLAEEVKTQAYDPRTRPWFKEAMAGLPGEIRWTQPYVFQTTQEPGISVAVRWLHPKTGESHILAFDVLLTDLSNFTRGLVHAKTGHVALLTMDAKVLGLPHPSAHAKEIDLKSSVLKEPQQVGLHTLAAAVAQWRESGAKSAAGFMLETQGQTWRASMQTLALRNIPLLVVALAPESDFSPWSNRVVGVFGFLLIAECLFALALTRHIRKRIYVPVRNMVDDLARLNSALAKDAKASAITAELVVNIQAVQSYAELAQTFFSGVAKVLDVGLASFYRVTGEAASLELCGAYAGDASMQAPVRIDFGDGLVGQVASERRALVLTNPPEEYCVIRSGLGTLPAKTLLIEPVISNQQIRGVFEIAFFTEASDADIRMIEGLLPTLAMAMEIIGRHEVLQSSLPGKDA